MSVTVVQGSIVRQPDCDCIVNSANQNLRAGSGVCGAIYRAAGPELEPYSIRLAPLALAEAVITPGFQLPNPYIIHVRGPKYHFDENVSDNLAKALHNTIQLADANKIQRLAVPAISMGVYAFPPSEAVPILVSVAKKATAGTRHLAELRFVVLQDDLYIRFSNEIQKVNNGQDRAALPD